MPAALYWNISPHPSLCFMSGTCPGESASGQQQRESGWDSPIQNPTCTIRGLQGCGKVVGQRPSLGISVWCSQWCLWNGSISLSVNGFINLTCVSWHSLQWQSFSTLLIYQFCLRRVYSSQIWRPNETPVLWRSGALLVTYTYALKGHLQALGCHGCVSHRHGFCSHHFVKIRGPARLNSD